MFSIEDIHSVTDFQRNTKRHVARLKRTKAPMVLTVNGAAQVVVQDARAYQQMREVLDQLEEERFVAAVNEGLKALEEGRVMSLKEFERRGDELALRD